MPDVLKAEKREGKTKSEIKQIRAEGKIPAVVYGRKAGSAAISVEGKELIALLRGNPHAVLQIEMPTGGKHSVMVQDVQKDIMTGAILHVDLHQISMNDPVHTNVVVTLTGEAKGVREGGILTLETREIEIKCLPKDIPASLTADISGLEIGGHLLVSDLELPDKVELLSNPDDVVAAILAPKKGEEEPAAETFEPAPEAEDAAPAESE
jgi:large subunit ribosomal protein L25